MLFLLVMIDWSGTCRSGKISESVCGVWRSRRSRERDTWICRIFSGGSKNTYVVACRLWVYPSSFVWRQGREGVSALLPFACLLGLYLFSVGYSASVGVCTTTRLRVAVSCGLLSKLL